jgi:hypothetical protein
MQAERRGGFKKHAYFWRRIVDARMPSARGIMQIAFRSYPGDRRYPFSTFDSCSFRVSWSPRALLASRS